MTEQLTGRRTQAVRRDFEMALERLLEGKPTNKKLREQARAQKLRITVAAVALEAGHSRTLIGSEDCRFPQIRDRILDISRGKDQPVTTVTRLATSLRATNAQLRAEVKVLRSQQALMLARMIEAERKADVAETQMETTTGGASNGGANIVRLPKPVPTGPTTRRR